MPRQVAAVAAVAAAADARHLYRTWLWQATNASRTTHRTLSATSGQMLEVSREVHAANKYPCWRFAMHLSVPCQCMAVAFCAVQTH